MKTPKILIVIFLSFPINNLDCQSSKLDFVRNEISNFSVFDTGKEGKEILKKTETLPIDDLVYLMQEGYPIEKIYSFWAYVRKENSDYRKYFSELVSDTSKVKIYQRGCLAFGPKEVGSYIFDIAEDLGGRYEVAKIYPKYLDSMALEVDFYWSIRGNINCRLMKLNAPPNLYCKVREKALNGDVPATIGLSSYKKEQDIPIIKKHLKPDAQTILYGLKCVENFPHKDFEEDVLNIYYSKMRQKYPMIFNYVCQVLRKYETSTVEKAFNELISNPDKYYYQNVNLWYSFEKNKEYEHPIRKKLIERLGMEEIEKMLEKYNSINYWKLSCQENKN